MPAPESSPVIPVRHARPQEHHCSSARASRQNMTKPTGFPGLLPYITSRAQSASTCCPISSVHPSAGERRTTDRAADQRESQAVAKRRATHTPECTIVGGGGETGRRGSAGGTRAAHQKQRWLCSNTGSQSSQAQLPAPRVGRVKEHIKRKRWQRKPSRPTR